jgi:DUF4097 and DUF4098 domain-containing protein YvlB
MRTFAFTICAISLAACALMAQTPTMTCQDRDSRFCDIRETTLPASALLAVDGKQNGGVSVKGTNRSDILVRAMVQAQGETETDARTTGAQVIVHTSGGSVTADGPTGGRWSVQYEILVPVHTNLKIATHNGGVAIAGVQSAIEFHAVNGGVSLKDTGGNVRGDTVNGGISVTIANAQWKGQGLDVSTTNGGVSLKIPEQFSALLDLATVNGGINVKLPNAPASRSRGQISMTLGAGGPLIRVHTQNGGVTLQRS